MNNQENQNTVMQYLSFLLFLMLIIAFATYSSGLDNSDELAIHRQKKMRIFEEMPHMVAPWHIAQSRSGYRGQLSSATFYIKIQDNDFQNFNKTFENHMRQYGFYGACRDQEFLSVRTNSIQSQSYAVIEWTYPYMACHTSNG